MLFISHKTEDKSVANEVLRRVLERGYSEKQIFLDSDPGSGIETGAEWEKKIFESLKHTRAMIVLCSPNWLTSQWCFVELGYAKAMAISIFPIIIEKCDVGSTLSSTQAIDLTNTSDAVARDAAFERLWNSLEEQHLGPKDNLPWPTPGEKDNCPFPGLMYFDEKHAPVFFGREQERDSVIQKMKEMRQNGVPRLLMIVGGSGSGKSSLLRAGVLSWLRHPTEQRDWLVLPTLRYGETPNDDVTLLSRLAEVIADRYPQDHPQRPKWEDLREKFESENVEQATRDFVDATLKLSRALRENGPRPSQVGDQALTTLFAIDQFEELLTKASGPSSLKFLRFLRTLLSRSNGRLLVIGTIRSDYLDTYEQHTESLKSPFLDLYRLPPFSWERVTEVIAKPAELVDVTFTEELITRLKGDAPNSDALPLLAFTLEKLFRQCAGDKIVELHEYEQLGGMSGAITQAVTRILPADLSKEAEQALRRSFVNHLAQVNEKDEFVRRRAIWETLPDAAKPLLAKFVQPERLLQRSGNKGEVVEVTHEAIFRCWDQLKRWLEDDLPALRLRRRVETLANEWRRSHSAANPLGDDGLLLTRAQLGALDDWLQQSELVLPESEASFVDASRVKRKSDEQRELEQARQFADAQAARAAAEMERAQEAEKNQQLAEAAQRQAEQYALADQAAAKRQRNLKRWAFVAAGATAMALCVAMILKLRADQARDLAKLATIAAQKQATIATAQRLAAQAEITRKEHPERSLLLSVAASRLTFGNEPPVTAPIDSLRNGLADVSGRVLGGHTATITDFKNSPDGHWLLTGSNDKTVRLWDLHAGDPAASSVSFRGFDDPSKDRMGFSPDSRWMYIQSSQYKTVRVWDLRESGPFLEPAINVPGDERPPLYNFSPNGEWLALCGGDFTSVELWRLEKSPVKFATLMEQTAKIEKLSLSSDGRWMASGSKDGSIRLWNLKATDAATSSSLLVDQSPGTIDLGFSPDARWLLVAANDSTTRLWNTHVFEKDAGPILLSGYRDDFVDYKFSPDSQWLAINSGSQRSYNAHLCDLRSSEQLGSAVTLTEIEGYRTTVAFSSDSRWALVDYESGAGNEVLDLNLPVPLVAPINLQGANPIQLSRDSLWLATASDRGTEVWSMGTSMVAGEPVSLKGDLKAFSRNSRWVVTKGGGDVVHAWNLSETNRSTTSIDFHGVTLGSDDEINIVGDRWLYRVHFSEGSVSLWPIHDPMASPLVLRGQEGNPTNVILDDAHWLFTWSPDAPTARVWDLAAPSPVPGIFPLEVPGREIVSPDGRWLLTVDENAHDGNVSAYLWDLTTPARNLKPISLPGKSVPEFSHDGHWLVTDGERDDTKLLWDLRGLVAPAQPLASLQNGNAKPTTVFSPDDSWLAVSGKDVTQLMIWDLRHSTVSSEGIPLIGKTGDFSRIAFSRNGDRLLSTNEQDKQLHLYLWNLRNVQSAKPIRLEGRAQQKDLIHLDATSASIYSEDLKSVSLWDLRDTNSESIPAVARSLNGSSSTMLATSSDNRWLVTGPVRGSEDPLILWDLSAQSPDVKKYELMRGNNSFERHLNVCQFIPGGNWLLIVNMEGFAHVCDLKSKDPALNPKAISGVIRSIDSRGEWDSATARSPHWDYWHRATSPDGRWFVSDKGRLWDLRIPEWDLKPFILPTQETTIIRRDFSDDSRWLVTYSKNGHARLWDLHADDPGETRIVLRGQGATIISSVVFGPDSQWMITFTDELPSELWNLNKKTTGTPISLPGYKRSSDGIGTISRGGRWFMCGDNRKNFRLWPLQVDDLIDLARIRVGRNLTLAEWEQYCPDEPYRPTFLDLPFPRYEKRYSVIARNLTLTKWTELFPGQPYQKTFPELSVPDVGK